MSSPFNHKLIYPENIKTDNAFNNKKIHHELPGTNRKVYKDSKELTKDIVGKYRYINDPILGNRPPTVSKKHGGKRKTQTSKKGGNNKTNKRRQKNKTYKRNYSK